MADEVKAQKLAAARKRLKEYQKTQSSKKVVSKDGHDNPQKHQMATSTENLTPADSMASSTHSTFDNSMIVQDSNFLNQEPDIRNTTIQPNSNTLVDNKSNANFFNNALFQGSENDHILSNYFDTMSQNVNTNNALNAFSHNFATIPNQQLDVTDNIAETKTVLLSSDINMDKPNQNSEYADPFEVSENQINTFVPTSDYIFSNKENIALPSFSADTEELKECSNKLIEENHNIENIIQFDQHMLPERSKSECALDYNLPVETSENQNSIFSNTESLRQLSSQLNSLIDDEITQNVAGSSQLELRNQELAALLKNEQMKTEQFNLQLREYMTRITQLETELQQTRNENDTKLSREIGPLQEQLQYHVQTVGILVGEKTELTMALNQSQTTAKQKTSECEELQGRLKASRHRVVELEKEVNFLKSSKDNFDKHEQENNREFERLRLEYNLLKEQFQEVSEESSELKEKLNAKISESLNMQQEMQEKNSQLSLTQLRIQQLTSGENANIESQLEILNQQKISLEQQIAELTQTVKVVSSERDQASQQYQQYVQQLNGQIQSLAEKLDTKNNENETLAKREQSLVKHISDLEKHLQQLQNERQNFVPVKTENDADVKKLEETINNLQSEKAHLEENLKTEIQKHNQFEEEIQEKDDLILELEAKLEQLKDQPDAAKLLAAMESDKVAASRAVEQNKKLKKQLEELHDGFIKMSNSKLELTEKLESELHQSKELSEKLTHSSSTVEHLHSVIATKDKELTELQNSSTDMQKQILLQNQLTDRLRHYEAQGSSSDFLQQELQQARIEYEKLKSEYESLQYKFTFLSDNKTEQSKYKEDLNDAEEINLLKGKVAQLEKINTDLNTKFNQSKESISDDVDSESYPKEKENSDQYLNSEKAMEQLEERFKKTMAEVANLTEEKQRLEHLVLQLQSETETIGEYVALYQCQRAMLKEKTLEKDEQLKRLSSDREEMKIKLEELNALVERLVVEKGIIPKELLHHNLLNSSNEVCAVHKQDEIKNEIEDENKEKIINGRNSDNNNENYGTAGKIIALLSEIKTSNLVQPGDSIQNFHPCPWCSGQLITV